MAFRVRIKLPAKYDPALLANGLERGVQRATAMLTNAAIANAPRKTGTLKRSIHAEVNPIGGRLTGRVIQDTGVARYGPFVEFGTGIYGPTGEPITPKKAPFLQWKSPDGRFIRKKSVNGMKPRRYMRDAFDQNKNQVPEIVKEEIQKALDQMKTGGA